VLPVLLRRRTALLALAAALATGPLALPATATPSPTSGPAAGASPGPSAPAAPVPTLPPSATAAAADVCAGASQESPVVVEVTTLAPRAPTSADEPFRVAGRLVNCGEQAVSGLQVRLVTGGRLSTRSQLRRATSEPVIGSRRLEAQDAQVTDLGAGASTRFDVRVRVADLRLGARNGVHPLAVQARGRTGSGSRGPVGLASTFVPWFPEGPVAPTRLAWLLPLVDEPHRGPGAVMLSDELEELVAGSGRLAQVLVGGRVGAAGGCEPPALPTGDAGPADGCRGEAVPVTWAVDPDLVHSVEAMTRPYAVLVDGRRTDRPASPAAAAWLSSLAAAAADGDLLALPYADPDVVALSRTGSPLVDDVALLQQLGRSEVRRLLDAEPLQGVAWPPPGPVTGVVDTLSGSERRALVVRASALTGRQSGTASDRTPSARTTLPSTVEPVPALVPDDALSDLLAPDPTDDGWQGERLAEQRWLAETAMIAAERPGESRTLVVAPERRAALPPALLAAAVADTGRLPWLCGVPLADAAAGTERCAQLPDAQGPAPAAGPAVPVASVPDVQALPPAFVRAVAVVRRDSDQFTEQVLTPDDDGAKAIRARLLRARGRAESAAWRARPAEGRRMLDLLRDDVAALRSRVTLVGEPALLTGREGTVQLVVQNLLDQPVNVGVRLDPTSAARLTSEDTEIQVVPGQSTVPVSVRVEARTAGRFTARVGLVDASGEPFGSTVELAVRSTQYGRVALAVTGVAAAVLLVAAGVRITRRVRNPPGDQEPVEPREPARPGSGV
jgi:hypothetical protein